MKFLLRSVALVALLTLLLPGTGLAHFGGEAFIFVTADHVDPGQPFEVIVADLSPGSTVELTVTREDGPLAVGNAVSDTQGHFLTSATVPADFPHGYVELVATAQDGTRVSTFVLIGPRTGAEGPAPAPAQSGFPIDPSLIVLGVILGGSVAAVGYLFLRRSQPTTEPAVEKRPVPRKRPRRKTRPS